MKILQIHNFYQHGGGEDVVMLAERELLREYGHDVKFYGVSNHSIEGVLLKLKTAWRATYSNYSRSKVAAEIDSYKPDVVHAHNLFPLLSPSIYDACRDAKVPVVQTLHNFRTVCPGGVLLRKNKVCEECIGGSAYRAAVHRCYRGDFLGSLAVARMVEYHRRHCTWQKKVDCFIALTEFGKTKFVQAGFPEAKITVKPNFLCDFEPMDRCGKRGGFALFVGRLSEEKGIRLMIEAWERLPGIHLRIVGDGPLAHWVDKQAKRIPNVEWLGSKSRAEVISLMNEAVALIFPSICYEGFPLTILEAYSVGLPVVASDHGSMSTLVGHKRTGLHFRSGDANDLADQVKWAFAHIGELSKMGCNARTEFEGKYSAKENYRTLLNIYERVIHDKREMRQFV